MKEILRKDQLTTTQITLIRSGLKNSKELPSTVVIFFTGSQGKYLRGNCDAERVRKDVLAIYIRKKLLI